jgi:hypothetical protein
MRHEPDLDEEQVASRWTWLDTPCTDDELAEIEDRWRRTAEWNESYGPPMKESPSADIARLFATIRWLKDHVSG